MSDLDNVSPKGRNQKSSAQRLKITERREMAFALRRSGMSYPLIARNLKVSVGTAYRDVMLTLERTATKTAEVAKEVRHLEIARLDEMQVSVWERALSGDPQAIQTCLSIINTRARLSGAFEQMELGDVSVPVRLVSAKVNKTKG